MTAWQTKAFSLWCWFIVVFGAVIVVAALNPAVGALLFAILGHPEPVPSSPHLTFTTALMGAVTMGWGLTLLAMAGQQLGENVWQRVMIAFVVWYVIDSGLSIATGFWRNAVSNTVVLAAFLFIRSRGAKAARG